MKNVKYLILGAGPSGLTLANALIQAGVPKKEVCILEEHSVVGGLCRSEIVDGAPLDIGGGHFLDLKRKEVLDFIFSFMPRDEWNIFERVSKIRINGVEVDHPLEANLWQFPVEVQVDYLMSIAEAGCVSGEEMPVSFADWVTWKFGKKIAQEYMLPYNRKIWSMDPNELGTYWLHKLPNVSFKETLLSCLEGKPAGDLPAHGTFLYPKKYGYGEVWRRMGDALEGVLIKNCAVEKVNLETLTVNDNWRAEYIISTIPWTLWPNYCDLPVEILNAIRTLKNAPIDVDYFPENLDNNAHWIYEPDESTTHHRLLLRSNFASNSRGYWTEANACRSTPTEGIRFHNKFAYPINTLNKPVAIEKILSWGRDKGVIGLGRWGRWEHMNSDVAVAESLQMAKILLDDKGI